jgi:hypothetical protein
MLDEVIWKVSSGLEAWNRLSDMARNLWLVTGDGLYATIDALDHYLGLAFRYCNRVVLFIDYLQQVPVLDSERVRLGRGASRMALFRRQRNPNCQNRSSNSA